VGQLLRDKGHEYGTTTGRPRRCGWLDLSLVRYTGMVNGYDSINITKLDILDTLEEIKVGVGYRLDGKAIQHIPASLEDFGRVEVVY
jgi:adenylosuccinate synthase